jgi:hypothetical protein
VFIIGKEKIMKYSEDEIQSVLEFLEEMRDELLDRHEYSDKSEDDKMTDEWAMELAIEMIENIGNN